MTTINYNPTLTKYLVKKNFFVNNNRQKIMLINKYAYLEIREKSHI